MSYPGGTEPEYFWSLNIAARTQGIFQALCPTRCIRRQTAHLYSRDSGLREARTLWFHTTVCGVPSAWYPIGLPPVPARRAACLRFPARIRPDRPGRLLIAGAASTRRHVHCVPVFSGG